MTSGEMKKGIYIISAALFIIFFGAFVVGSYIREETGAEFKKTCEAVNGSPAWTGKQWECLKK